MYPVYCIAPTSQTNYITQPRSLDDNDYECYLLRCELFLQNVQRISFFRPFHISQCLHNNHRFFFCFISTTRITTFLYFVSCIFCFVNECLWWINFINIWWNLLSHNERFIIDILMDTNPNARPKNTPQVFLVRGKRYSNVISEDFHGSGQKEKYNPWYLK